MPRFELDNFDRWRVAQAREALAASEQLDMGDDRAMARMLGRLEVVLRSLLEMVDEATGGESR